jgi:hypothetical protein
MKMLTSKSMWGLRYSLWHGQNIHDPPSSRLINTHNSLKNETFMFNFNNLQTKPFDEFIIDPLFSIFQEKKLLYLGSVIWSKKNQKIKTI